jgi:threonine dehydrogenase-like Zn-dependent dehydrogenase
VGDCVRVLTIQAPGQAAFVEVDEEPLPEGAFRLDTRYTALSAGTELTFFKGTNPYLHATWDEQLGLFRKDRPAVAYPVTRLGYMEVGQVRATRTAAVPEGALVAMAYGHRTSYVADPVTEHFVVLPHDIEPLLGVYLAHMGPICANGLLHAAADVVRGDVTQLGDGVRGRLVVVTGAGVVGLLTAVFARLHGAAEVIVIDRTPQRLAAAAALGLEVIDEREGTAAERIKERWRRATGDRGADLVFQCRGQASYLALALQALRPQGTVIDLAFYQGGAEEVRLGEEFHHNGLTVRCAQISRVPRGLAHLWDRRRLSLETMELLRAQGQAIRQSLVTDVLALEAAPNLLEDLAERRRHAIQVVFEVGKSDGGQAATAR